MRLLWDTSKWCIKKAVKSTGHDGYNITFQNATKQMLGMLDAVMTFQNSADLEPTNRQALTVCQFIPFGTRHRQPNNPIGKSPLSQHNN